MRGPAGEGGDGLAACTVGELDDAAAEVAVHVHGGDLADDEPVQGQGREAQRPEDHALVVGSAGGDPVAGAQRPCRAEDHGHMVAPGAGLRLDIAPIRRRVAPNVATSSLSVTPVATAGAHRVAARHHGGRTPRRGDAAG